VSLRDKRRRYRRMTVRLHAVYVHRGVEHEVVATTLGAGGLFVSSDDPLPKGIRLRIRFRLPGGIREHELDARVVWAHRQGDPGSQGHGMGLAFTNPAQSAPLATELDTFAPDASDGVDPLGSPANAAARSEPKASGDPS
jgi:Tfp pilus assembly protein PilZ